MLPSFKRRSWKSCLAEAIWNSCALVLSAEVWRIYANFWEHERKHRPDEKKKANIFLPDSERVASFFFYRLVGVSGLKLTPKTTTVARGNELILALKNFQNFWKG